MTTDTYTTKVLKADDGYVLTQSADVDIKERIFGTVIYLAATDSEDNYKEITIEEAKALKQEQAAAIEEEMNALNEEKTENDVELKE